METKKDYLYHFLAFLTSAIWGTTFVSTKVLINNGLSPVEIMFFRFVLAYICIWFISSKKIWAANWKDELMLVGVGLSGGSLYFVAENIALGITLASNVSLIICTAPIFTAMLLRLFYKKENLRRNFVYGSVMALIGVGFVVFNGSFMLQINPLGDMLSFSAALLWGIYSLLLKKLDNRYTVLFITRKVFAYGILTILPVFIFRPITWEPTVFLNPLVIGNLLFLGVIASMGGYIMWNVSVQKLGAIRSSNYLYLSPLVTLLTSAIVIDETITSIALIGATLILMGVYVAEKGFKFNFAKMQTDKI
ncbi:MAG: DMT family transporter [Bacteroidales bacterium]